MNIRLNKKHQRTLEAISSTQTPATLQWRRIEALFKALGATKKERRGSGVTFRLNGETVGFHLPHPRKEAHRYHIRDARYFLKRIGITL